MISFETTSLVKAIIGLGLSVSVLLVFFNRNRLKALFTRNVAVTTYATFLCLRLVPFLCVYVYLDQEPRSDVDFFFRKALAAFQGKMVYRDFLSYHAPLFGYLISLPLLIWRSGKAIILLMAVVEFIIAKETLRYYQSRIKSAMIWFVLYYLLPLPFVAIILSSQEDLWMWGFGLLTLAVPVGRRFSFWVGVLWGIAMLTIKFMLIVFLIPVFFLIPNRMQYVAGLLLVGVPSLLILYNLVGMAFLMPIQHSSLPMTPNIVSVIRPVFSLGTYFDRVPLTYLNWTGLLITIGSASYVGHYFRELGYQRLLPLLYVFTFNLFMLCLPSSPGYYLFGYALPLVFVVLAVEPRTRIWVAFTVLNLLLVVQPVLSVVYNQQELYNQWTLIDQPTKWIDYLMQCSAVVIMLYLVGAVLRQIKQVFQRKKQIEATLSVPSI